MSTLNLLVRPALTPILRNRKSCLMITGVAAIHVALTTLGLPSWKCPFRYGLGLPCPGCGLSRAVEALINQHWQESFRIHAFAPVLILGLLIIGITGLLPENYKNSLVNFFEKLEKKTGVIMFLLYGLLAYWLIRLLFFTEELYQIVM